MHPSLLICLALLAADTHGATTRTADIHVRDPYVLAAAKEHKYYLYGTCLPGGRGGFDTYRSTDLENWEGPFPAFRPKPGFWATRDYWAPEVHCYKGKYYMFASFKADNASRGTQILVADHPEGPFVPLTEKQVTPDGWECLDGTLYIDREGNPWIVFSHEWVQVGNGEICAMKLTSDLKSAAGKPVLLFRAGDAKWTHSLNKTKPEIVTDGPFLYRTESGSLLILWSSFGTHDYTTGVAESRSGEITGPWIQSDKALDIEDAGHSMIFRTFDGRLMLTMHRPNKANRERAVFIPIKETKDGIELIR